jgi:hypothetical protein
MAGHAYPVAQGRRSPGASLEPMTTQIVQTRNNGAEAFSVTRFQSDGAVHSARWIATGKVDEAPSPADFISGGVAAIRGAAVAAPRVAAGLINAGRRVRGEPYIGQTLYRVFGDEALPYGHSWTRRRPDGSPDFRDDAGLPPQNSGRFVIQGRTHDLTNFKTRPAQPLGPNRGGWDEVIVPDPTSQLRTTRVSGVNPEF